MNNTEFAQKAKSIAENYRTAYVWGAFGLTANAANMQRMIDQYAKNRDYLDRAKKIYGSGFFFDCAGLIKGILWGFCGNASKTYGGAVYASGGVPDISADRMIKECREVSENFGALTVGEVVWMSGHIGIYIGGGKVAEATPAWSGGVQITDISAGGKRTKNGSGSAYWQKHGKLPHLTYESEEGSMLTSGNDIIWELMNGEYQLEISEVDRAVKALDSAKSSPEFASLYWILYKLVNGNG